MPQHPFTEKRSDNFVRKTSFLSGCCIMTDTLQCYCSKHKHSLRAEISAVTGHVSLYHHLFLQVAVPRPQLLPSHPRQLNFSPESLSDGCNCHRVPVSRCLVYYCERCVQCPVQNYRAGQARLGRTLLLRSAGPAAVMV